MSTKRSLILKVIIFVLLLSFIISPGFRTTQIINKFEARDDEIITNLPLLFEEIKKRNGVSYSSPIWSTIPDMEMIIDSGSNSQLDIQFTMDVNYTTDAMHKIRIAMDDIELCNISLKQYPHYHLIPSHYHQIPIHNHTFPFHYHDYFHNHYGSGTTEVDGWWFDQHSHNFGSYTTTDNIITYGSSPETTMNNYNIVTGSYSGYTKTNTDDTTSNYPVNLRYITDYLPEGSHVIQAQWWTNGTIQSVENIERKLIIREINPTKIPSFTPKIIQTKTSTAYNELSSVADNWSTIQNMEINLTSQGNSRLDIAFFMTVMITAGSPAKFRILLDDAVEIGNVTLEIASHNHNFNHSHIFTDHNHYLSHSHAVNVHSHSLSRALSYCDDYQCDHSHYIPEGGVTNTGGYTESTTFTSGSWSGFTGDFEGDLEEPYSYGKENNILPVFMSYVTDALPFGDHKITVQWITESGIKFSSLGTTQSLTVREEDLRIELDWNTGDLKPESIKNSNNIKSSSNIWKTIFEINSYFSNNSSLDIQYSMTLNYTIGDSHNLRIMYDDVEVGMLTIGRTSHNHSIYHTHYQLHYHNTFPHSHQIPSHVHVFQGFTGEGGFSSHQHQYSEPTLFGYSTTQSSSVPSGVSSGFTGPPTAEFSGLSMGFLITPVNLNCRLDSVMEGDHRIVVQWNTNGILESPNGSLRSLTVQNLVPDVLGPIISNVSSFQSVIDSNYYITAELVDASGIKNASVFYSVNNGPWNKLKMDPYTGNDYRANIGSFTAGSIVKYYIYSYDNSISENLGVNDNNGNYYSFNVLSETTTTSSSSSSNPESISIDTSTSTSNPTSNGKSSTSSSKDKQSSGFEGPLLIASLCSLSIMIKRRKFNKK